MIYGQTMLVGYANEDRDVRVGSGIARGDRDVDGLRSGRIDVVGQHLSVEGRRGKGDGRSDGKKEENASEHLGL